MKKILLFTLCVLSLNQLFGQFTFSTNSIDVQASTRFTQSGAVTVPPMTYPNLPTITVTRTNLKCSSLQIKLENSSNTILDLKSTSTPQVFTAPASSTPVNFSIVGTADPSATSGVETVSLKIGLNTTNYNINVRARIDWNKAYSEKDGGGLAAYGRQLVGDFDGDGSEEILGVSSWLTMFKYNINSKNWDWRWSDYGVASSSIPYWHQLKNYTASCYVGNIDGIVGDEIIGNFQTVSGPNQYFTTVFKFNSNLNSWYVLWSNTNASGVVTFPFYLGAHKLIIGNFDSDNKKEIIAANAYGVQVYQFQSATTSFITKNISMSTEFIDYLKTNLDLTKVVVADYFKDSNNIDEIFAQNVGTFHYPTLFASVSQQFKKIWNSTTKIGTSKLYDQWGAFSGFMAGGNLDSDNWTELIMINPSVGGISSFDYCYTGSITSPSGNFYSHLNSSGKIEEENIVGKSYSLVKAIVNAPSFLIVRNISNKIFNMYATPLGRDRSFSNTDYSKPNTTDKLYPNPATDRITYETELADNQTATMQLFDLAGRQLSQKELISGYNKVDFDLNDIANGMYLYKVISDGKTLKAGKFVVQH
jgi:hypothetical protein